VNAVSRLSKDVLPLLISWLILPVIILIGFGIYAIIELDCALYFLVLLAVITLAVILTLMWRRRNTVAPDTIDPQDSLVDASTDWGSHDIQTWESLNKHIQTQLLKNSEWAKLQDHSLEIITLTAKRYDRNELAFSIPESLKMVEEVSRRYRYILKAHVPFIENIHLSYLRLGLDYKNQLSAGSKAAKWAFNAYRLLRISSPYLAVISEIRTLMIDKVLNGVSAELQYKLKRALLQEVLSVAIDLYSERFKIDDSEIGRCNVANQDENRIAPPLAPLRVCLIGQVSSGKSSILNAILGRVAAEVNPLPSTDNITGYECSKDGIDKLRIIDLPGLDGNKLTKQKLLEQYTNSDLVLWVLKANQSARVLDDEFMSCIDDFYSKEKNQSRKRPRIIGLLTHIDRLKPVSDWSPPYNLDNPDSEKAKNIKSAVDYNKSILTISTILPVCIANSAPSFNLDALEHLLAEHYDEGIHAQLNRRRIEAREKINFREQPMRLVRTGQALFKAVVK